MPERRFLETHTESCTESRHTSCTCLVTSFGQIIVSSVFPDLDKRCNFYFNSNSIKSEHDKPKVQKTQQRYIDQIARSNINPHQLDNFQKQYKQHYQLGSTQLDNFRITNMGVVPWSTISAACLTKLT